MEKTMLNALTKELGAPMVMPIKTLEATSEGEPDV